MLDKIRQDTIKVDVIGSYSKLKRIASLRYFSIQYFNFYFCR